MPDASPDPTAASGPRRTPPVRRTATAAASLLLVVGLAACAKDTTSTVDAATNGTDGTAVNDTTAASGAPAAEVDLADALAKTSAVTTGRVDMTFTLSGTPDGHDGTVLSLAGAFDTANKESSLDWDLSALLGDTLGPAADGRSTVVTSNGHMYLKSSAVGQGLGVTKPWIEVTGANELSAPFTGGGATVDPSGPMLDQLTGAGPATTIGTESINGVDTTHVRVDLDPKGLLSQAKGMPDDMKALMDEALTSGATVPVDVWVDGDGLIRRMSFELSARALGAPSTGDWGKSGDAAFQVTIDLHDLGQPVDIVVPAPDEIGTFDLGSLGGLLGGDPSN